MRLFPETLESDLIESTEMVVKLQDIVESQAARIAELEAALQIAKHNEQYTHAANVNLYKKLDAQAGRDEMTCTAQLLALADAAIDECNKDDSTWYTTFSLSFLSHRFIDGADGKFIAAANPETIKQMCLREQKLVELVRLQHDALEEFRSMSACDEAIEAFNTWENGK